MSVSKSFASRMGWTAAVTTLVFGSALAVAVAADEKPKAAAPAAAPAAASTKVVKPWSELTSLNDEQKTKIHEIHAKALAQINEIEKQEKADIMAVLTDGQKGELKELAAKEKKEAAEKRAAAAAAKKAGNAPAPAPAAPEKKD